MGAPRTVRRCAALLLLAGLVGACGGKRDDPGNGDASGAGSPGSEVSKAAQNSDANAGKAEAGAGTSLFSGDASGALLGGKKPPPLAVYAVPAKNPILLGETASIRIEVENTGKTPVRCAEVLHDVLSAYLELSFRDTRAEYVKIQKGYFATILDKAKTRQPRRVTTLPPGDKASTTLRFLLPEAGRYRLRAVYRGFGPANLLFYRSDWVPVEVLPDGKATTLRTLANTDEGEMEFAFFPDEALATTIHFLTLVSRRFYDTNARFHRVQKDFVIQAGVRGETGDVGPGFYIPQEFNRRPHLEGTLSMFRHTAHVDTAGSKFFICLGMDRENQKALDGHYTVFGRVAKGLETARKIGAVSVDSRMMPIEPIRINSMTVVKR
ncbi:MAG: peptidylprolyl isomerase [Planctomycetota bacterium]|jgi:peptidyl-prolyl cis-trans isomerase A (cyclophilin A)